MAYQQSEKTFAEIGDTISTYLEARDWLDNPSRSVAMSIVLEAAELMEHYQWSSEPVGTHDDIAEELADVLIYAFQFAQSNQIDIADAILKKLEKTKKKYPAEAFKNKSEEEMHNAWVDAKLHHKKEGLL